MYALAHPSLYLYEFLVARQEQVMKKVQAIVVSALVKDMEMKQVYQGKNFLVMECPWVNLWLIGLTMAAF